MFQSQLKQNRVDKNSEGEAKGRAERDEVSVCEIEFGFVHTTALKQNDENFCCFVLIRIGIEP